MRKAWATAKRAVPEVYKKKKSLFLEIIISFPTTEVRFLPVCGCYSADWAAACTGMGAVETQRHLTALAHQNIPRQCIGAALCEKTGC